MTFDSACSSENLSPAPVATNSRFCLTRKRAKIEPWLQRRDLSGRGFELLAQFAGARGRIRQVRAALRKLGLRHRELGLGDAELVLIGRRVDAEQQLALLDQPVGLDGHFDDAPLSPAE